MSTRKYNAGGVAVCRIAATMLFLFLLPGVHAFKLTPITKDFAPSGRGASQAFQVSNDSEQKVAVQISMLSRETRLNGEEVNLPADDDFVVFPSQMLLDPGEVQTVRVQWIGEPEPSRELAYRILAEQLPINLSKEAASGAKINLVVRYLGSVYIVPDGAKPDLVVNSTVQETQQDGLRRLEIMFHNRGTRHVLLHDLHLTLQAGGTSIELSPDELKGIEGENVLAGEIRQFLLPRPSNLPEQPVTIRAFGFKRPN